MSEEDGGWGFFSGAKWVVDAAVATLVDEPVPDAGGADDEPLVLYRKDAPEAAPPAEKEAEAAAAAEEEEEGERVVLYRRELPAAGEEEQEEEDAWGALLPAVGAADVEAAALAGLSAVEAFGSTLAALVGEVDAAAAAEDTGGGGGGGGGARVPKRLLAAVLRLDGEPEAGPDGRAPALPFREAFRLAGGAADAEALAALEGPPRALAAVSKFLTLREEPKDEEVEEEVEEQYEEEVEEEVPDDDADDAAPAAKEPKDELDALDDELNALTWDPDLDLDLDAPAKPKEEEEAPKKKKTRRRTVVRTRKVRRRVRRPLAPVPLDEHPAAAEVRGLAEAAAFVAARLEAGAGEADAKELERAVADVRRRQAARAAAVVAHHAAVVATEVLALAGDGAEAAGVDWAALVRTESREAAALARLALRTVADAAPKDRLGAKSALRAALTALARPLSLAFQRGQQQQRQQQQQDE